MFERFTDKARRIVVGAQEEARALNHHSIGSEHILLAITTAPDSIAAKVLTELAVDLQAARARVLTQEPRGAESATSHMPFTASAKKTLELSLREALQLGHNYIGSEHILLGLIREGSGPGARILDELGVELDRARQKVVELLSGYGSERRPPPPPRPIGVMPQTPLAGSSSPACSFCGRDLWDVGRYVSGEQAVICDVCVTAAQRVVADAPPDENALVMPPRVSGDVPDEKAVGAIEYAVQSVFSNVGDEEWVTCVEDGANLLPARHEVGTRFPMIMPSSIRVVRVRFRSPETADVRFTVFLSEGPGAPGIPLEGSVARHDGRWRVTRDTYCTAVQRAGVQCPPRDE
jgi:hypothetical protein